MTPLYKVLEQAKLIYDERNQHWFLLEGVSLIGKVHK